MKKVDSGDRIGVREMERGIAWPTYTSSKVDQINNVDIDSLRYFINKPMFFIFFMFFSKSVPLFHRCVAVDIDCYAEFAQAFITFVSDNTVLRRVVTGVMASKDIIMGLCVLALGITHGYNSLTICMF